MSRLNPSVLLLSVIGLMAGILLYLDGNSTPIEAKDPASLASVSPPSGAVKPLQDQTLLNTGAVAMTSTANSETDSLETVAEESMRSLAIRVKGLKNQSSSLYVAVFDSAKGFPKPEHSRETTTVPITEDTADFSLSLPDSATTGIAVFQDLNGDGKLTKNSFGLPIEPYGFSNNARSVFGPPSFSQAAFLVSEKMPLMEIRVR